MEHVHIGVEHLLIYGVAALVFLNLWRLLAAMLVTSENAYAEKAGAAMGALVHFGG